jgi:hypothetical protein
MDRRTFVAGTGAVIVAAPLAAEAQPSGRVAHVGTLSVDVESSLGLLASMSSPLMMLPGLRSSRR